MSDGLLAALYEVVGRWRREADEAEVTHRHSGPEQVDARSRAQVMRTLAAELGRVLEEWEEARVRDPTREEKRG